MRRLLVITNLIILLTSTPSYAKECVILLHGFFKSAKAMEHIAGDLLEAGYHVHNITYPTMHGTIDAIVDEHLHPTLNYDNCNRVHFVGHSMGGLVIRHYLKKHPLSNLGKVVLIASPNQGSEIAGYFADSEMMRNLFGGAVLDLAIDSAFLKNLGEPDYHVGIISAGKPRYGLAYLWLPEDSEHDGVVTVKSTKLANMKDQITIHSTHNYILREEIVFKQLRHFLDKGVFLH